MYARICRFATAAGFISAFGLAVPVAAGIGVVAVNQHGPNEPSDHGDCTYCPQNSGLCPQGCPDDNPPAGFHEFDNFEATYVCLTCEAAAGDDPGPVEQDASEGI